MIKRLMLSMVAVASLAGGAAFAQDGGAECQAGSAYGNRCGVNPGDRGVWNQVPYGYGTPQYPINNSGGPVVGYGNNGYSGILGAVIGSVLGGSQVYDHNNYPYGQGQVYQQYPYGQVYPQYQPNRRDRDGDGVRNRDDRYPDDPRYR